jgi:hypothetical protein
MPHVSSRRDAVLALTIPAFLLGVVPALRAQDVSWSRQFGTIQFDQANGVAAVDGNVYVVGDITGDFPGQTSTSGKNLFLRRYDYAGNESWTRQFGPNTTTSEVSATGVAANAGGVFVAGWTRGALGQAQIGDYDAFVRKYDLNGNEQWTRQFGISTSTVLANGVAVDGTGVYVAGYVDCCGASLVPGQPPGADAFVRKYDMDGKELWTRQFGSIDIDRASAIAVDITGVYVAGTTQGAMAGPQGQMDWFVVKFDANGKTIWVRQYGEASSNEEANAIAVGPLGLYVGGRTTANAQGLWDALVMKLDAGDGSRQWTRQFGGQDGDNVLGLTMGLTHLIVAGAVDGPLPGQTYGGAQDAFYRLYDSGGAEVTTVEFGGGLNDFATGASADARGFYISGSKNGGELGLTPVGDNDAFVIKVAPPPLVRVPGPRPVPEGGRRGRRPGA